MKKRIVFGTLLFAFVVSTYAEIAKMRFSLVENPKDFNVTFMPTKSMKEIKSKENPDVDIAKAYMINENGQEGEVRFSFFKDEKNDIASLDLEFRIYLQMCLTNAIGSGGQTTQPTFMNPEDVKAEFNGDLGLSLLAINPTSEYAKGYQFMYIDCYCKNEVGIVMRVYLFNNLEFMGINTSDGTQINPNPLYNNFHIFKFN